MRPHRFDQKKKEREREREREREGDLRLKANRILCVSSSITSHQNIASYDDCILDT